MLGKYFLCFYNFYLCHMNSYVAGQITLELTEAVNNQLCDSSYSGWLTLGSAKPDSLQPWLDWEILGGFTELITTSLRPLSKTAVVGFSEVR